VNRSGCSGVAKDGGSSPRNAVDVLQVLKFGNNPITFRLLRSSSLDDEYLSQAISLNIAVTTHSCLVARQHEGVRKHFNQCVAAGVNGYSNFQLVHNRLLVAVLLCVKSLASNIHNNNPYADETR
jgi:hypothetical protein